VPRLAARQGGFTLFELVIVVCLVAIFFAVALDRLLRYQEIAEKTAMEATIGALRSAQALQVAARVMHGGFTALPTLADENPIDWLAEPPVGYIGALHDPAVAHVPKGSWYFDLKNKELVYRPQRTRFFAPAPDGSDRIRFKVIVRVSPKGESNLAAELSELGIRPLFPVQWSPEF
jgi:prepilin-type N-terminal cleavage/methylation domain-containing protein